jgi:hypothetical protein
MSVQFSRQAIAALSESFPRPTSALVQRLVWARNDPGKERIRMRLLDFTDVQLRSALGLTLVDIAILRAGTPRNPPIWENNEGKIIPERSTIPPFSTRATARCTRRAWLRRCECHHPLRLSRDRSRTHRGSCRELSYWCKLRRLREIAPRDRTRATGYILVLLGESTAVASSCHDPYRAGGSKASEGIRKIAQRFGVSATTVQRLGRQ